MIKPIPQLVEIMVLFGFNPRTFVNAFRELPCYFRNRTELKRQMKNSSADFPFGKAYPCLADRHSNSGSASGQYFHQDLLVARRIYDNKPTTHVDVGSRVDGFVAHVASFREIEVIDIRPLPNSVTNVRFLQADMMADIDTNLVGYCDSLSCLHALEHFGLGRYGDPVCYEGHLLGLNNLHRILKKGGKLYFSVPIGPQRIQFDAHRVFSVGYLLKQFSGKYAIDQFSFVNDKGDLHENVQMTEEEITNNFGCNYGCGIFEMTKL